MANAEPTIPTNMLVAALWWAGKGINVLPLHYPTDGHCSCGDPDCSNAAKHPIARLAPRGLSQATTDTETIRRWWTQEPYANIGARTGEMFDLLDIDSGQGATTLQTISESLGGMPTNLGIARSGRAVGGVHIYAVPGGHKALAGGKTAPPGIDVKGRGGYAVVAPSLHISGYRYEWIDQRFDTAEITGDVPWDKFYNALVVKPTQTPIARRPHTVIAPDAANAYGNAVLTRAVNLVTASTPGNRWQTLATEAIPLVARGIDGDCIDRDTGIRELEEAARKVGLDSREIHRISHLVDDMVAAGITHPIRPTQGADHTELPTVEYATETEAREDPWDPPWPLRYPTPPFPVEIFGWIAPTIEELAAHLQVPVDLIGMMLLSIVAATVRGRTRVIITDGWEEPLNLYTATVLGSGETKSPALARLIAPLRRMEEQARAHTKQLISEAQFTKDIAEERARRTRERSIKATGDDAILARAEAWQAQKQYEDITVPTMPLYLAGDMTPEALVFKLAEQDGALAHLSAEGELLDTIVGGRYSGGSPFLTPLLTAHDGREPVRVHRRREPDIEVLHPCLTLGLAVQPQVLEQMGKVDAAVQRGLAARFLYSIPASLVGRRDMRARTPFNDQPVATLLQQVDRIAAGVSGTNGDGLGTSGSGALTSRNEGFGDFGHRGPSEGVGVQQQGGFGDIGHKCNKYVFLASSLSLLLHYREGLEPRRAAETGDLGDLGAWINKLDGQLARMAALLQMVYDSAPTTTDPPARGAQNPQNHGYVGPHATASAIILADYLITHAIEAHALMGGATTATNINAAKQILGWIQRHERNEFTEHEAERSLRRRVTFREPGTVHAACVTLERLGWLRRIPQPPGTPGRPSIRYLAHPGAFP